MFDEKEYLAALTPPMYKTRDGQTFVGVILSSDEVAPLEARLRGCSQSWVLTQAAMEAVIEACFPRSRWARLWSVNPVWRHVRKLPPPGQMRAVLDFISAQATAIGLPSAPGSEQGRGVAVQHDGSNTES